MIRSNRIRIWLYFILPVLAPASATAASMCTVEPFIPAPDPSGKPHVTADAAILKKDVAIATGDVRLEWNRQALEAPRLRYNRDTRRVIAEKGLRYRRKGMSLKAEAARVDIDDSTGTFLDARFVITGNGGHGDAAKIIWLGQGRYRLKNADYTTCPLPDPAWRLTADEIQLNRKSGRGEAFGTVLYFYGVPVFYSPYLNFPIDDQRHTGFLTPTIGYTDDSGFELATPFYINLAPDRDLTITPRLLTERGLLLAAQFRYLDPHSKGTLEVEVLPSDAKFGDDRELVHFDHIAQITPDVALDIDYGWASDEQYLADLGSTLASVSNAQLEQRIRLTVASPGIRFALIAQDFQSMGDADEPGVFDREPYARLPAAKLSMLSQTGRWQVGLNVSVVNFQHDTRVEGMRYHLRPRIRWSIQKPGWFIVSQASYYYTRYDLEGPGRVVQNRGIPSFSLDAGLRFQRVLANGWIQTLEPRIKYLYTAYEDQSGLPIFDTAAPDLHYRRLFADNRFVGIDRIGDANQITIGLTSRFIDPETGRTVLRLGLGRVYGFRELRVHLPTPTPIGYGERHSNIVANAQYRPTANWYAGASVQYEPTTQRFNRVSVRAGYNDGKGRRLNLAYYFFRNLRPLPTGPGFETLEQAQLTVAWPLGDAWQFIGRWNYSLEKGQSVNTLVGFEYRASCCWAIRAAWQRVVGDHQGGYDTAIMLQIELTGLASFGDSIESLLQHDIVSRDSNYYHLQFP